MVCSSLQSNLVSSCRILHVLWLSFDLPTPTLSPLSVLQIGKCSVGRIKSFSVWPTASLRLSIRACSVAFARIFIHFKKFFLDFNLDPCEVRLPPCLAEQVVYPFRVLRFSSLHTYDCTSDIWRCHSCYREGFVEWSSFLSIRLSGDGVFLVSHFCVGGSASHRVYSPTEKHGASADTDGMSIWFLIWHFRSVSCTSVIYLPDNSRVLRARSTFELNSSQRYIHFPVSQSIVEVKSSWTGVFAGLGLR